ncbi:dynein light chain Tctex-type isoform X1 [Drosophila nasuta]|uniref:dynein light chain Tctex-type isoform X1 n=1 Tax=Drosophila nasuta TaxID=42062 RepID=UPI00295EA6A3|nr:dynein light chain Tctex-type isoform X1 [Drosophila nasuta]
MPLFGAKKTTRASNASVAVKRSRASVRSPGANTTSGDILTPSGQKIASNQSNVSGSDSDPDEDKHPEVSPATDVTIYNEYEMGPAFGCKFPLPFIRFMVERLINQKFKGKTYQPGDAVKWVREVADEVNLKMEGMCRQPRYKHVIQAIIYQQNGAGFFCGARAIWDKLADDYTSLTFDGGTFMCIVVIFGIYQY